MTPKEQDELARCWAVADRALTRHEEMTRITINACMRLQREYAALILTAYTEDAQITAWAKGSDPGVVKLVQIGRGMPRGMCSHCNTWAALAPGGQCVWGCSPARTDFTKVIQSLEAVLKDVQVLEGKRSS